jgi:hypothetical protein
LSGGGRGQITPLLFTPAVLSAPIKNFLHSGGPNYIFRMMSAATTMSGGFWVMGATRPPVAFLLRWLRAVGLQKLHFLRLEFDLKWNFQRRLLRKLIQVCRKNHDKTVALEFLRVLKEWRHCVHKHNSEEYNTAIKKYVVGMCNKGNIKFYREIKDFYRAMN